MFAGRSYTLSLHQDIRIHKLQLQVRSKHKLCTFESLNIIFMPYVSIPDLTGPEQDLVPVFQ